MKLLTTIKYDERFEIIGAYENTVPVEFCAYTMYWKNRNDNGFMNDHKQQFQISYKKGFIPQDAWEEMEQDF